MSRELDEYIQRSNLEKIIRYQKIEYNIHINMNNCIGNFLAGINLKDYKEYQNAYKSMYSSYYNLKYTTKNNDEVKNLKMK